MVTVHNDSMMNIEADSLKSAYREIEIQSEIDGELESVTIDKQNGKITIRFKHDDSQ